MIGRADVNDVRIAMSRGDQVIDVRTAEEYATTHIAGSTLIPLFAVPLRMSELDRHRPVVVVCRSGARATQACEYLAAHGFDVQVLEGGIEAWSAAGQPVMTGTHSFA